MTLETMKELIGIVHIQEEEVPNAKRMRVGEEEVSLSHPITAAVPPEEEDVPAPLQGPQLWPRQRKKSGRPPLSWSHQRKRSPRPTGSPIAFPLDGRGCLVTVDGNGPDDEGPVLPLVSLSLFFFFLKNVGDSSLPFFS
jgi:hypothetical protein